MYLFVLFGINGNVGKYYKIVDKLGATLLSRDPLTNVLAVPLKGAYGVARKKTIFFLVRVYRHRSDNDDTRALINA